MYRVVFLNAYGGITSINHLTIGDSRLDVAVRCGSCGMRCDTGSVRRLMGLGLWHNFVSGWIVVKGCGLFPARGERFKYRLYGVRAHDSDSD